MCDFTDFTLSSLSGKHKSSLTSLKIMMMGQFGARRFLSFCVLGSILVASRSTRAHAAESVDESREVKLYIYHARAQSHVGCAKITTAAPTFPFFF